MMKPLKCTKREIPISKNCNIKNEFLLGVDLSHLPNDQTKKVEKLLAFSKDENGIGCIESLKLKSNFKDDAPVS